ncbi:hypothetical protein [Lysinibacillus sp. LZ02]|uniref:hypothetical protein n=1 Tax=Lysinibacillus sp. LZ02 TaxID=3420668 RepID=UPI003D364A69
MKKSLRIMLEAIRRGLISEIIKRRDDKKLNTETAFKFIADVNNATVEEINIWVIGASFHGMKLEDYVIDGLPIPF